VATELRSLGLEVTQGLGKTGVVATLRSGTSEKTIALRADMDALPMQEENQFAHKSKNNGVMHACGHDGHTAMLLGAAKQLVKNPSFDGIVHFIFQPAEEGLAGAQAMIDDGLFEQFPTDAVFGMHNWPSLNFGEFGMRPNAMMASYDTFEIRIQGKGGHAAMPYQACDPVVACAQIVNSIQTILGRNVNPLNTGVVSVTQIHCGSADNVIPDSATIRGSVRSLDEGTHALIEKRLKEIVRGTCQALQVECEIDYNHIYPILHNTPEYAEFAADVASSLVGEEKVQDHFPPALGSEDFAFMLNAKPGVYVLLGTGQGENPCPLHSPNYDFNDDILFLGASYWCALVHHALPAK